MTEPAFPNLTRPDAPTIVLGPHHVGSSEQPQGVISSDADRLRRQDWPQGLVAVTWFVNTAGDSLLTCAQWGDDLAHDDHLRRHGNRPAVAGPPRYRVHRALGRDEESRTPGCLVTAAFDVDGPERQLHLTERIIQVQTQAETAPHPGAVSAHFLLSTDGTRVLLWTQWTSAAAHQQAAEAGNHDDVHDVFSSTPGARFTHGDRYRVGAVLLPESAPRAPRAAADRPTGLTD